MEGGTHPKKEISMKAKTILRALMAGVGAILLGSASQSETIHHGVPRQPGNSIPEGSRELCSGVPENTPLISGLKTGWAVALPSSPSIRLLFSDQVLGCQIPDLMARGSDTGACTGSWTFALTLVPEMQKAGVYDLPSYPVDFAKAVTFATPAEGCGQTSCAGGGSASGPGSRGPQATMEIYSVTDECITGQIRDYESGWVIPPLDFNGAFHAVRCTPPSP